jgi:hypothetical protein
VQAAVVTVTLAAHREPNAAYAHLADARVPCTTAQGLERAVKSGGDAKRAAAVREAEKQRKLNATPARVEPGAAEAAAAAMATAVAAARQARYEGELLEYQQRMSNVSRNRREAIAKWQASTGTTMAKPETERDTRYGARCARRARSACTAYLLACSFVHCLLLLSVQHPCGCVRPAARRVRELGLRHVAPRRRGRRQLERHARAHVRGKSKHVQPGRAVLHSSFLTCNALRRSVARATTRTRTAAHTTWTTPRRPCSTTAGWALTRG